LTEKLKETRQYKFGMGLSLLSIFFGVIREFVIVTLLGFTSTNDQLQIYLSIFYSVSLSNDAIKLSVLNLCNHMSLRRLVFAATVIGLPYAILIGIVFNYISGGLTFSLLVVAVIGSFLNLIMILFVTYKQRYGAFLSSLAVNVSPNFLLIPGIILIYFLAAKHSVSYIIYLYALLPLVQIAFLLLIKIEAPAVKLEHKISLLDGILVFLKQGLATVGEQFFQTILRSCFFRFGTGYLSLLSIFMRIYLAARFIFIDTYIGSKIKVWGEVKNEFSSIVDRLLAKHGVSIIICLVALIFCYGLKINLWYFALQLTILLGLSFYFDTLLRIVYYRINSYKHDPYLIIGMGLFDGVFALVGFVVSQYTVFSVMFLLWFWYIARIYLKLWYYNKLKMVLLHN